MNRRERLMATIRGEAVDRPAVSFYELNGMTQDTADFYSSAEAAIAGGEDPFNIYTHQSWKPLLDLTREQTDLIVMMGVPFKDTPQDPLEERTTIETWEDDNGSRFSRASIRTDTRTLTSLTRRDRNVNTTWCLEHLLKDEDDAMAWLSLPEREFGGVPDVSRVLEMEKRLGDDGIVMLDTGDPLCSIAPLFEMGEYTVLAMTEPELFSRLIDRAARQLYPRIEAIARALPGRLWRVVGPEYASPPYLPPELFRRYVTEYDKPVVDSIHRYGGYARIHSHGRLKDILDHIADTGCMGLDPIEPPHQGDVELSYVRERYGRQMVLFGNLEISDIESMPTELFRKRVRTALIEGTAGEGRGFVLMPSSCPYGRELPDLTMRNYEVIIEEVHAFCLAGV